MWLARQLKLVAQTSPRTILYVHRNPRHQQHGITLPYLYLTIHVPSHYTIDFSFEVTILDDKETIRRFRSSTYQSTTTIKPDICAFPLKLEKQPKKLTRDAVLLPRSKKRKIGGYISSSYDDESNYYGPSTNDDGDNEDDYNSSCETVSCWNRICVPLSEYTKRAYGTNYVETMHVQIHANCQVKRVYFAEKEVHEDDELPQEFRLYYQP